MTNSRPTAMASCQLCCCEATVDLKVEIFGVDQAEVCKPVCYDCLYHEVEFLRSLIGGR
jgi:hypothetical protein